jgi:polar amino acid transport system substrate-binding protein
MSTNPPADGRPSWAVRTVFAYLQEPPFCALDETGEAIGCDVELARHILSALGVERVDFVRTEFAELLPGLGDGRWTMTTGLFITPERARHVAFSRPIWALPDGLLVAAGNPKEIRDYGSIARDPSARIGVIRDQVQHRSALAAGIPNARAVIYATQDEAAEAVRNGAVDAYASVAMAHHGYLAHRGYLAKTGDAALEVVEVGGGAQQGGFAFSLANDGLQEAVDDVLAAYLGSPAHRALMARYGFDGRQVDLVVPAG